MSFVATLDNRTPFEALHALLPDGRGGEAVLVVLKASFELGEQGPQLAAKPAEIRMTDELAGAPELGMCRADADLALFKPRVDIVLVDPVAYAPGGKPAAQFFVELHVGYPDGASADEAAHDASQVQLLKTLLVSGDRSWIDGVPSEPQPFVDMALDWTRSFGGVVSIEEGVLDERNPAGVGYAGARSSDPRVLSELPNIEDPRAPLRTRDSSTQPVGFGVVPRAWLPRRALAGTFDAGWQRRRWPLAPLDQDPAYAQCAPADQQLARYVGGEPLRAVNLSPEGELSLRLPHLDVPLHLIYADRCTRAQLRVDTVELELATGRVTLTARAAIPIVRKQPVLEQVILGHLKPGWLRARQSGRCYLDLRGEGGTDLARRCFW